MVVEEFKVGNANIKINDSCIVPPDKVKQIIERMEILAFNNERRKSK